MDEETSKTATAIRRRLLVARYLATEGEQDALAQHLAALEAIHPLVRNLAEGWFAFDRGDLDAVSARCAPSLDFPVELGPSLFELHARTQLALGHPPLASRLAEQWSKLEPQATTPRALRATALAMQGQTDAARAAFQQVLGEDPAQFEALMGLGALLVVEGHAAAAVPLFERAVQARPTDASAAASLTRAREEAGSIGEA